MVASMSSASCESPLARKISTYLIISISAMATPCENGFPAAVEPSTRIVLGTGAASAPLEIVVGRQGGARDDGRAGLGQASGDRAARRRRVGARQAPHRPNCKPASRAVEARADERVQGGAGAGGGRAADRGGAAGRRGGAAIQRAALVRSQEGTRHKNGPGGSRYLTTHRFFGQPSCMGALVAAP